jgi:hypothetical protein
MTRRRGNDDAVGDPERVAAEVEEAARQAVDAGRPGDAIALLRDGITRLGALTPVPAEVGWLEYTLAGLLFRSAGDPEDNRDLAIEVLERAVTRGIESVPVLYARAWGSLGDRYATRRRGDRADNRRSALRAYECALLLTAPVAPEDEWALNSLHYARTLLEDGTDDLGIAAEGIVAYWQAAQAAHSAGAEELSAEAVSGALTALDELVRRVGTVGSPTPFEVALPSRSSSGRSPQEGGPDDAWARVQAVLAVVMTHERTMLTDEQAFEAGRTWEQVAAKAEELGAESLLGVAQHHLGLLRLRLRSPEPGDRHAARRELESAALLIDPAGHPWSFRRNEEELDRLWDASQPPPGSGSGSG